MDAVYTSIEAQKSTGSLHAHSQVFVQCLHQHTSIYDLLQILREKPDNIIKEYLNYKSHVCRQVYTEDSEIVDNKLTIAESQWPEYKSNTMLTSIPGYTMKNDYEVSERTFAGERVDKIKAFVSEGALWLKAYLHNDVEELQRLKQHHVHMVNEKTN